MQHVHVYKNRDSTPDLSSSETETVAQVHY